MYNEDKQDDFLQGDVIRINFNTAKLEEHISNPPLKTLKKEINTKEFDHFAAILSHSCDVSLKNVGKRLRFVFSPLRPVFPELRERFNGNLLKCNDEESDFETPLNYFVYIRHPQIKDEDCFIDLTNCYSLRIKELDINQKVLELTEEMRDKLKKRIYVSFIRPNE